MPNADGLHTNSGSHNALPADTEFPTIDILSNECAKLGAIIAKYNAQNHFRLRLLHRHTTIPDGCVLLGAGIEGNLGVWTRSMPISNLDVEGIRPHVFSVDTVGSSTQSRSKVSLFPSEFRVGPPAKNNIDAQFFTELADCLCANGLERIIGIEATQGQCEKMIEFSFDAGNLLLTESVVTGQFDSLETAWAITEDGTVDKDGETRCVIVQGQHVRATKSAVKDLADALKTLKDEGVLIVTS